jgi:ABC-type dipeptide/oligopeptide/nickel transport system ATPase component
MNPSSAAKPLNDVVLAVDQLEVAFSTPDGVVQAVKGVSFKITRGRTLALVGESGSGKSVTSYAIMQLLDLPGRITHGKIRLYSARSGQIDITALAPEAPELRAIRGQLISMIFQEPMTALSPVHRIGEQIAEAILTHHPVSNAEAKRRTIEMLEKVGIPEPARRFSQYPHEMSGGMRQRVVIAMALACNPELLIADEPTTALDVTIQAQILGLIRRMQREMGCSVLLITHDFGVVAQVADDVAVMYRGEIVEHGDVRTVLKTPRHPYTQRLLDALPSRRRLGRPSSPPPPERSA